MKCLFLIFVSANMVLANPGQILVGQLKTYLSCAETLSQSTEHGGMCPGTFDGLSCWEASPPGDTVRVPCPDFVPESRKDEFATWECLSNGSWARSSPGDSEPRPNYSACAFTHQLDHNPELLRNVLEELNKLEVDTFTIPGGGAAFYHCVETVLSQLPPERGDSIEQRFCPRTFDGWGCWNDTPAGEVAYIECPAFITGFNPKKRAHKVCLPDGTWYRHPDTNKTWSNYTTCVDKEDLQFRMTITNIYVSGYSTSVVALVISLCIFFYFKSLQCTRITIHKNLFISFIVNNIMWICWYTEILPYPNIVFESGLGCQILHVIVHYFMVSNYFWMFCEGLYLHTLLVVAFVSESRLLKWFYLLGWGVPAVLIVIYAGVRSSSPEDVKYCWMEESVYTWIISGPVCVSIMINLVFLVNIVRVLWTKLKAVNSPDAHQTRKAARATLILIPLLGLHYVLIPFRPENDKQLEAIHEIVSAIVTSFQGLCVSLLFCFFNGEVLALLQKKSHQLLNHPDRSMSYAATTVSFLRSQSTDKTQTRVSISKEAYKNGDPV